VAQPPTSADPFSIIAWCEDRWWGRLLLLPLSFASQLYKLAVTVRVSLYRFGILPSRQLKVNGAKIRVVCVGNLTVGGAGKTSTVEHLGRVIQGQRVAVAVLIRGYKGSRKGKLTVVSDGSSPKYNAGDVGDESYLLARKLSGVPVIVGKDRYQAGKYALEKFSPGVILLDDGYQHLSLVRDINILAIDSASPFGNGRLLPRGPLREPLSALKRAQIFLLTKVDLAPETGSLEQTLRGYNSQAIILHSRHRPLDLVDLRGNRTATLSWLRGRRVLGFCGIGSPDAFLHTLEKQGANVAAFRRYPDHHHYNAEDLRDLEAQAKAHKAEALVSTEKDGVKLRHIASEFPLYFLRIKLEILSDNKRWEAALKLITAGL